MALDIEGRVVMVTGGARRIGAAIVREFAAKGAKVIIHHHTSVAEAEELAEEVQACTVSGDLTAEEQRLRIVDEVRKIIEKADCEGLFCLVHSASVFQRASIEEFDSKQVRRMFAVNAEAPLLLTGDLVEQLRAGGGSIISLTDTSWQRPWPHYSAYCASKAALRSWTLALAQELAPEVRANCIAPGAILPAANEEHLIETIAARIPLARWGEPSDIAEAVVFLARAPYISAQVLSVDGGWSGASHHP